MVSVLLAVVLHNLAGWSVVAETDKAANSAIPMGSRSNQPEHIVHHVAEYEGLASGYTPVFCYSVAGAWVFPQLFPDGCWAGKGSLLTWFLSALLPQAAVGWLADDLFRRPASDAIS